MSKTIVFCADGTWNGPDKDDKAPDGNAPIGDGVCDPQLTNVCKLFAWLSGDLSSTKMPSGSCARPSLRPDTRKIGSTRS